MSTSPPPTAEVLAAAALRRNENSGSGVSGAQLVQEHEQRQMFRRLINPGIYRPNSQEVALAALKTLSTLAENILREPDNPKYQQFMPTNTTIKRRLVDPKGALQYAVALGFHVDVKDFQPLYVFNPRKMADLRIGAAILKEAIDLETEKQERSQRNMVDQKAVAAAAAQNVKLAFLDDRKMKMQRDERERALRDARARQGASADSAPVLLSAAPRPIPGVGHTLSSSAPSSDPDVADAPPPYHDSD
ncbi:hypothetical protein HYDPIDRAFT_35903 [Hydnomerulius pinastri MD-312]|nr:hypothetical protein HYDPIDRAFT_35903 [Hydnomerulius pinastri MD-312]